MSELEQDVKPILVPLIKGYRRSLDQTAQLKVATWSCMKAAIVEADGCRLAEDGVRSSIYERQEPPIDMVVRLAAFDEPATLALFDPHGHGVGSIGQSVSLWITTFMVGHLTVQVLGRSGSVQTSVIEQVPGGVRDGHVFTVWPPQPDAVEWPPPIPLSRDRVPSFLVEPYPQLGPVGGLPDPAVCPRCEVVHKAVARALPVTEAV